MKKFALLLLAASAILASCQKSVKIPVSYTVENAQGNALPDIYIPDSGSYDLAAWVKFLTGNSTDSVSLLLKGLPADVVPDHDSISGLPTYTGHFILHTNHAAQAKYPVSIVARAPYNDPKSYNFNLTVIPADCSLYLLGDYTGQNSCDARSYTYTATVARTGVVNSIAILNFGGYGINTSTRIYIDCNTDALSIPSQNIGNGTIVQGSGSFTGTKMTINYTATNTPTGTNETCTAVFTK